MAPIDTWGGTGHPHGPAGQEKLLGMDPAGDAEEPLSLRRLRESLSSLERLERQRGELRGRSSYDAHPFAASASAASASCSPTVLAGAGGYGLSIDGERSSFIDPGLPLRGVHFSSAVPVIDPAPFQPLPAEGASSGVASPQRPQAALIPPRPPSRERDIPGARAPSPGSRGPSRERDSALALALERSQDRIDALQQERDEALRQAASHEAEVVRLTVQLERSEAEHRSLAEERQREHAETSRIRREHRDSLEQLAALRAEAHQSRATSEEWRQRFDKLVADQRQQIAALEDAGSRASRDLLEHEGRAADFGEGLYACIHERTALLHFVVDLLAALQSLFYDPTPFVLVPPNRHRGTGARARSSSITRLHGDAHRHSGCSACVKPSRPSSAYGTRHTDGRQEWRDGLAELQELIASLENEIGETSERYTSQVHRIVDEAEQCARTIRGAETDASLAINDRLNDKGVFRTCTVWVEQERRRLEQLGLPPDALAPRIDWAEERAMYHATTRTMESKFAQLLKLKRVLQARQVKKK